MVFSEFFNDSHINHFIRHRFTLRLNRNKIKGRGRLRGRRRPLGGPPAPRLRPDRRQGPDQRHHGPGQDPQRHLRAGFAFGKESRKSKWSPTSFVYRLHSIAEASFGRDEEERIAETSFLEKEIVFRRGCNRGSFIPTEQTTRTTKINIVRKCLITRINSTPNSQKRSLGNGQA